MLPAPSKKGANPTKESDARLGSLIRRTLTGWEFWLSLVIAAWIAVLGDEGGLREVGSAVGTAQSAVGIAVAGVVLAALAIFTVFLSEDYVELLASAEPGIEADLEPFLFTMVIAALAAGSGVGLVAVGKPVDTWVIRLMFFLSTFFFAYLLFLMRELVWVLARHTRLRARQIQLRKKRPAQLPERTPRN